MSKPILTEIDLLPEDMQLIYYDWLDGVPVEPHKIRLIELYIKFAKARKKEHETGVKK
jgi:hypothetical protein|tara:strand:- start:45 stop:218 length:174 start_codon:yes stop_codon:yes gene_type:complete